MKIINKKFKKLLLLSSALLLMASQSAMALNCNTNTTTPAERSRELIFTDVVVQQNAPAGTVLATTWSGGYASGKGFMTCTTTWQLATQLPLFPTLSSYGNNVYNTNIAGVGLKMSTYQSGEPLPLNKSIPGNVLFKLDGIGITGQLIKTTAGATGTGTINGGQVAKMSIVSNPILFAELNMWTTKVTAGSCTINTTTINVKLDPATTDNFSGAGSTAKPKNFNITLNCNSGTSIKLTLEGKRAGPTGVLGLNTGKDQASGIGIQLLKGTTPVALGTKLNFGTSGSGTTQLPLTARYYQTAAIVPGTTNTSATFTVEYN